MTVLFGYAMKNRHSSCHVKFFLKGKIMSSQSFVKPWWKQLWPWLLISGPALAALGCAITIWLAFTQHVDQPIRDGVNKKGLKIEAVSK
jgi:hypothetical protein